MKPEEIKDALTTFIKSGSSNGQEENRKKLLKLIPLFVAAPELLEAVKKLLNVCEDIGVEDREEFNDDVLFAQDAVTKAERASP